MRDHLRPGIHPISDEEVPDGWRAVQLRDVSSTIAGGRLGLTKQDDYISSGTPAFSAAGQDGFVSRTEFRSVDGVVLSAIGANCGRCFLALGDWTTLANTQAIMPSGELDARFLHYRTNREDYWPRTGSAQPFIKPSSIGQCWLKLPPLSEQRRIAEILDTLDEAILATEQVIAKLQQMKQGLLHDLLTRGIDEHGELRPRPEEAPGLYKDSPLGRIPTNWNVCLLDDAAIRGSGHTPSKSVPGYWNGGIRWVSLADSKRLDKVYIYETDKEISDLGIANSSAVKHPAGTVILSRDAGVGKSAILGSEMAVSQHFMAWRCGPELNNVFLYYWLQHRKRHFESIAFGSTIQTIGLPFFKRLQIAVPPVAQQEAAAKGLLRMENRLLDELRHADKLRTLKQGLMDDLLTGRVRTLPTEATA